MKIYHVETNTIVMAESEWVVDSGHFEFNLLPQDLSGKYWSRANEMKNSRKIKTVPNIRQSNKFIIGDYAWRELANIQTVSDTTHVVVLLAWQRCYLSFLIAFRNNNNIKGENLVLGRNLTLHESSFSRSWASWFLAAGMRVNYGPLWRVGMLSFYILFHLLR